MTIPIAVIGSDGVILAINEAWRTSAHRLGPSHLANDLGGNYITHCDVAGGENALDAAALADGLRAVLEGERAEYRGEYSTDPQPECRRYAVRASRCSDTDGHAVVCLEDITLRRQVESRSRHAHDALLRGIESMRDSESMFRDLVENIPEVFWLNDVEKGGTIYVSPAYESVWGRSGEMLCRDRFDFLASVHPDDRAKILATVRERKKGPVTHIYRLLDAGGSIRWIRARTTPVLDDVGRMVRIAGIAADITDLKQTQERLSDLARIVECCNDAIIGATMEGIVTSWNAAAQEIFGYSSGEVLGKSVAMLVPEDHVHGLGVFGKRLCRGEAVERTEAVCLCKDGRHISMSMSAFPVRDVGGALVGVSAIGHDVTERRQVERELAEAAARERQRIGQDLHDDICQRLTAISCLGRVLENRLTARGAPEAGDAERIVQMTQKVTQQTRDLARRLYVDDIGPGGLPRALQNLAADTEMAFNISCQFEGEGVAVPLASSTAMHLYRIAQEAVSNAARHADAGVIQLSFYRREAYVVLTVEDDGVGIAAPLPSQGLGLQIMDQRARMIGASLSIGSREPVGTRVACRLRVNNESTAN